jgi:hypothetical protein
MRWASRADRKAKALQRWHRWFAWLPTYIDGQYVWLERVYRKGTLRRSYDGGTYFTWEYKLEGTL